MPTVLFIGEDDQLQESCAEILRTIGVDTVCCCADCALTVHEGRECDLVVLCHTVPEPRCTAIAEAIRARSPRVSILLVIHTSAREPVNVHPAISATTPAHPDQFIVRSIDLLSRSGSSHGRVRRSRS